MTNLLVGTGRSWNTIVLSKLDVRRDTKHISFKSITFNPTGLINESGIYDTKMMKKSLPNITKLEFQGPTGPKFYPIGSGH